eukprot:CAMPEP_0115005468 /NCGR_PEP_ID=MMETSP0216-20121206/19885_1 /TAXON_ID=223996 /ORGANISM="Protocruzia adherens, Strain Boccale" /LENGTH=572 /DNA_ID=CAMNT_0002371791 /DNA_START=126 /DNA_END=1844 /DNA_ORIENTATION=-
MSSQVIVIGGGLSGLSAANTIAQQGGRVLLLDKNSFCGGNSTKATSGINGALTRTQIAKGIPDSVETFERDIALSATGGKEAPASELGKRMARDSAPAVEWLIHNFGLDLSLISRLGGHSQPRTHRGKQRFPGMTITYALLDRLEEIAQETPEVARIILKADVKKLLKNGNGDVVGVEYEKDGKTFTEYGPVIVATGGYGADYTQSSLLLKNRPDLKDLPTTNGEHCTGDGIKMAQAIGAGAVDLKYVQVHPTGLVHPKEPDSKVKFLAAEALRGCGGLLLDANGNRFCDELGRRDYVSGQMWKNKGPFRLILNSAASNEIAWHCKHYQGRGLMKKFNTGADLAKEMGIDVSVLKNTFEKYNAVAKAGKDEFGKKFYHNAPFDVNDWFNAAIVTPVVHYTMGGLHVNAEAEVLGDEGKIRGLWAAGEVMGGVHGINRLGGNSLLDCVVYGRVAGANASKYLYQDLLTRVRSVQGNRTSALSRLELIKGHLTSATDKTYTLEEVAKHDKEDDCWVVVGEQVLDVTTFLKDHPGGAKAILLYAGKEATDEFDMMHERKVIAKYAPHCVIGTVKK